MNIQVRRMHEARAMYRFERKMNNRLLTLAITIEYEDDDYHYISSGYSFPELKNDIEGIKRPITIIYNQPAGE